MTSTHNRWAIQICPASNKESVRHWSGPALFIQAHVGLHWRMNIQQLPTPNLWQAKTQLKIRRRTGSSRC